MKKLMLHASLSLALLCASTFVYAAAGSLDSTFGTGGKVDTGFGNNARPADAVLQLDGKLVVAGTFDNFQVATQVFGVVRYLTNGKLDTSYGKRGFASTNFTNFINSVSSMALQPDGRIVVAGNAMSADGTLSEFAIARFNTNGTLDSTFGSGGKVATNFVGVQAGGVSNPANAVLLQPDNKILVAGLASQCAKCIHYSALARYNPNGSLDTTFGTGGKVMVQAIGAIYTLGLDSNGNIFALSGSLAVEFNSKGALASAPAANIVASSHGFAAFQPDGKFVLCGVAQGPSGRRDIDVKISRFTSNGGADFTFLNNPFDFGAGGPFSNIGQAIVVQPNLQIVVGGISQTASFGNIFGVARLNSDGNLDQNFGSGGVLTTQFFATDQILAIVVQNDGKIIAVGQTLNPKTQLADLALARYLGQ